MHDELVKCGWDPLQAGTLARVVSEVQGSDAVAVFDADGTLWSGDVGEALLRALIKEGGLVGHEAGDYAPWRRYEELHAQDPTAAYALCVELLAGWSEQALVERCERLVRDHLPANEHQAIAGLARALEQAGVRVFVVSASNRWVVEAGARRLGLPDGRVLAMTTSVVDGLVTATVLEPLTNLEGKVAAVRDAVGCTPIIAAGNSVNDVPMLRTATGVAVMVNPSDEAYTVARGERWMVTNQAPRGATR